MSRIIGGTGRCVRCREKAVAWGGHVKKKNGDDVLAGWCAKHRHKNWYGWYGWHQKWMGCKEEG